MSLIGIALNLLVMVLLTAALVYGVRFEQKLKSMRAAQDAFVRSISKFDESAARAGAALGRLRGEAETLHDDLHSRIVAARELNQILDQKIAKIERLIADAEAATPPPAAPERLDAQGLMRQAERWLRSDDAALAPVNRFAAAEYEPEPPVELELRRPASMRRMRRPAQPEDDLFEDRS